MTVHISLDSQVRTRLQCWPQHPPGLIANRRAVHWIRARPGSRQGFDHPFLKLPGSTRLRTMPDGMWLGFGGSPSEAFVDLVVIEACSTLSNLLDKRSRFAPSTQSLMAVCPVKWLGHPEGAPRWQQTGILRHAPDGPLILPVRDMRVIYALKKRQYDGFLTHQVPHAHEFFVPMDALVAEKSDEDPAMQALFARASTCSNFLAAS